MKNYFGKYKTYIIFFLIAVFLEIFIFNFRFYQSLGYSETALTNPYFGSGLTNYDKSQGSVYAEKSGDKYIEFTNIDKKINNIYLDIVRENKNNESDKEKIKIIIKATDEANQEYLTLPSRDIVSSFERSKYISLNLAGVSDKIQICPDVSDENIFINSIVINRKVPFFFNIIRLILVFLIFSAVYIIRPSSVIWKIKFDEGSFKQILGILVLALANIFLICNFVFSNPFFQNLQMSNHLQYKKLTEAFLDGNTYIDEEPSDELIALENPYDTGARSKAGVSYKFDYAYFNGKYYVYFGAVPVLLFYMPYYLVTGTHISNEYVILITAILFLMFSFLLMREIVKRYFKNVSYALYFIFSELLFLSSGAVFPIKRPDFYFVPVFLAMMLAFAGLYFWITSIDKKQDFIKWRLCLGSICMSLIAGTRPQVLMASFLAVPLFWNKVFRDRKLFSKKSIIDTVIFIFPYIISAAAVMWYNYVRFGSVFDFGANYNLTTNDMTKRGFVLGRIPTGIFMYLFEPPVITPKFPFINSVSFYTDYMGNTIHELMFGGAFMCHIILFSVFGTFFGRIKKVLKEKNLLYFVLSSLAFAVIIVIADTEMAGLLQRYTVDFTWFLFIPACLCSMAIAEAYEKSEIYGKICCTIACLCGLSFLYDASAFFFVGDFSISDWNPEFFNKVMYAVKFWL